LYDVKPVPTALQAVVKEWQVKEKKTSLEEFLKLALDIILNTFPKESNSKREIGG